MNDMAQRLIAAADMLQGDGYVPTAALIRLAVADLQRLSAELTERTKERDEAREAFREVYRQTGYLAQGDLRKRWPWLEGK
jgi:hypothetical protein